MKNKLLLFNLISYFIITLIILNISHFSYNKEENFNGLFSEEKLITSGIITLISVIFFYIVDKWHLKETILRILLKYVIAFLIINVTSILLLYFTNNFFFVGYLITYITIPLVAIMVLIIPLYKISLKILR